MNIALNRLLEGIVATLRTDVIPNVLDAYARGQAVGVIDLLNNIGPRIEWARGPILDAINEKRLMLGEISRLVENGDIRDGLSLPESDLLAERDRLDGLIGDALALLHADQSTESRRQALSMLRKHLHDEQEREMRMTAKPLFAEIARGSGAGRADPGGGR